MCKYCDKEQVKEGVYLSKETEVLGEEATISLNTLLVQDMQEKTVLSTEVFLSGALLTFKDIAISYCPMCGRKLNEDDG